MSTNKDTINSYDAHAAGWAARMRGKKNIAHEYLEKPAMYKQLGQVNGLNVLCVGCGSGEECDYIQKQGAASVVGVDVSKGLIEQAKYAFPEIEFDTQDVESLQFPVESFDMVYSSLVMHYLSDWSRALSNIYRVLKPGGRFLLSTHHPIKWGAQSEKSGTKHIVKMGFSKDNQSADNFEIFGDYLNTRLIKDVWFGDMPVNYYHKPLSEIFTEITASGFGVKTLLEPKAIPAATKVKKDFYEIHQKIPLFLILELSKNK